MPRSKVNLVMRKQPTIIQEDPFKTQKEEDAYAKLLSSIISELSKRVIDKLKSDYSTKELSLENVQTAKRVIDAALQGLGTDDLKVKAWEFVEKGYLKGIILSSQQLKPLNVDIDINMGSSVAKKTLDRLRKLNDDNIDGFIDKLRSDVNKIVYDGLESGKSLKDIQDDIINQTGKSLKESIRLTSDAVIKAAREAERDTLLDAGIEIFRDIAVVDTRTCETCLALNGRIYSYDVLEKELYNMDTQQSLRDELADLTPSENFVDPEEGADGPPFHEFCRCHLQPVMTADQYKGTVKRTISEV